MSTTTMIYVGVGALAIWVVYRLSKKESIVPDLGGLFGGGAGMNPDGVVGGASTIPHAGGTSQYSAGHA